MAIVGDIVRLAVEYAAPNSSQALNVFWWVVTSSTITDPDLLDALEAWVQDNWGDVWATNGSDDYTLVGGTAQLINVDGTVKGNLGSFITNMAGGIISDMQSAAVSAFMMADTLEPKVRGKKYVPGVGETRIVDGALTAAGVTWLANLFTAWVTPITSGTTVLQPGVLSRSLLDFVTFGTAGGSITDIPAYQRRRKPDVGS